MSEPKDPKDPKRSLRQKVEAFAAGQQVQKLQAHWNKNKRTYLIGAGCLVGGYLLRRPHPIAPIFNNSVAPNIAPIFTNSVVQNGGYMRKIIRCVETDEMWPSVKVAAAATGNSINNMSRHLNGHEANVGNFHYVIEGLASG